MATKKKHEDLDFEINFFERFLEKKPDYVQALVALGDAYTKRGWYEKGLEVDKRLADLRPDDPLVFYNLACSYSLINSIGDASWALKKALDLGYRDFRWIEKDPDLENLRKSPEYQLMIEAKKGKRRRSR